MPINLPTFKFINRMIKDSFVDYAHSDLLELGRPHLHQSVGLGELPAEKLWTLLCKNVTCVENEIELEVMSRKDHKYDLILDIWFGSLAINPYTVFKAVFDLARPGSLMVHESAPYQGGIARSPRFFKRLASLCDYEVVEISRELESSIVRAAFIKPDHACFPERAEFDSLESV